ncbi:FecCD family ABC transporter permease [Wenxinia marina]|uniref:FecCD family ABC transporter permease n=1 Tax=Wenxinia marina TaxID=390641 RepID=UPI0003A0FB6A|nr:iron ABC transporter permease [Wenxinia marina]GGL71368.1 iron ABC transporter permease [Wenxinia marina]
MAVALRPAPSPRLVAAGLVLACAALLVAGLMSGDYALSPAEVLDTLAGDPPAPMAATVVWEFRLPRALVAFLVGAFLALSGALLQSLTRNPLADPGLVGISQGAALAVVAGAVLAPGLATGARPLLALGGALAVAGLVLSLSRSSRDGETLRFVLIGIGLSAMIAAVTRAFLTYGTLGSAMSSLGWLAGSLHAASWVELRWLSLAALALLPALVLAVRPLSALRFGTEVATALGLRARPARAALVALAVALAGVSVAAAGPLAFVGLVTPHLARRLAPAGIGGHLALTALAGAALTAAADLAGRLAFAPVQVPAGLVTALIGVPIFVALMLRPQPS